MMGFGNGDREDYRELDDDGELRPENKSLGRRKRRKGRRRDWLSAYDRPDSPEAQAQRFEDGMELMGGDE